MKFAAKMTLSVLVLLALFLSVNGTLLTVKSFQDNLAAAEEQNSQQQLKEKYLLESQLYATQTDTADLFSNKTIIQAAQIIGELTGSRSTFAVYVDGALSIYSNLPSTVHKIDQLAAVANAEDTYLLRKDGNTSMMLLTCALNVQGRDIKLLSAYDVSNVFDTRDAQLKNLLGITLVTLLLAAVLVGTLSILLTRPLAKLQAGSRQIADGNYAQRTCVNTHDEIGALSVSFDQMAEAVQQNVATLQDSIRQREDFVSAFTHEIKTPMTSMLGYAGLLRAAEHPPETQREAADYIYHETKRLEALSHKLMLLMGLQDEKITMEPVSVKTMFANIAKTLPQKDNAVPVQLLPTADKVLADRVLLEDLLRNLIINAQRACKKAGSVTVGCNAGSGMCEIYVQDTGCGIPKEEIEKITEPFYMVDKSRAREENGSGMGLALCNKIAQLHDTQLQFTSEVGIGTCVCISLPCATQGQENKNEN